MTLSDEERKAKQKEYDSRPEVKAKRKEYRIRPEVKTSRFKMNDKEKMNRNG